MANINRTFYEETKSILHKIQILKERGGILIRLHKCASGLMSTQFEEIHTRFRIWAGNFGALHEIENVCGLDQRLQDVPEVAQHIRGILRQLCGVLDKGTWKGEKVIVCKGTSRLHTLNHLLTLAQPHHLARVELSKPMNSPLMTGIMHV
jgi:hypothetical protein